MFISNSLRLCILGFCLLIILPFLTHQLQAQPQQVREITELAPELYRARDGGRTIVYMVTTEGIIITDPISVATASWLRGELEQRHGLPVRYVVYSHDHWDHASGGAVFADTAVFVGHANIIANMEADFPMLGGGMRDDNGNGMIDRNEADPIFINSFESFDVNEDGGVSPQEYFREIRRPDITYQDEMTLTLGGKTVQLIYLPPHHSADATAILFPEERVIFLADTFSGRFVPSHWGDFDSNPLASWIEAFRMVEELPWDQSVSGHPFPVGGKDEITAKRRHLEQLTAAVTAGIADGLTVEELKAEIRLPELADWPNYEPFEAAVEAAYINLTTF